MGPLGGLAAITRLVLVALLLACPIDRAQIRIDRAVALISDSLRAYKVFIDGEQVGKVHSGETQIFDVAPGAHEVQLKIDWVASPVIVADLAPGEQATFHCKPRDPITGMWFTFFSRDRYVQIERVDEPMERLS